MFTSDREKNKNRKKGASLFADYSNKKEKDKEAKKKEKDKEIPKNIEDKENPKNIADYFKSNSLQDFTSGKEGLEGVYYDEGDKTYKGRSRGDEETVDLANAVADQFYAPLTSKQDKYLRENVGDVQRELVGKGYDIGTYGEDQSGVDNILGEQTAYAYRKYLNEKNKKPDTSTREGRSKATLDKAVELQKQGKNPMLAFLENTKPSYDKKGEKRIKTAGKYSAISDALRNVIDAAGGSQGADIFKHKYSPLEKMTANLKEKRQTYSKNVADWEKQYGEALQKREDKRFASRESLKNKLFKREERERGQTFKAGESEKKRIEDRREAALGRQFKANLTEYTTNAKRKLAIDKIRENNSSEANRVNALTYKYYGDPKKDKELNYHNVIDKNGDSYMIPDGVYYSILNKIKGDPKSLEKYNTAMEYALNGEASKQVERNLVQEYFGQYYMQNSDGKYMEKQTVSQSNEEINSFIVNAFQKNSGDKALYNSIDMLMERGYPDGTKEKGTIEEQYEAYAKTVESYLKQAGINPDKEVGVIPQSQAPLGDHSSTSQPKQEKWGERDVIPVKKSRPQLVGYKDARYNEWKPYVPPTKEELDRKMMDGEREKVFEKFKVIN